MRGGLDVSIPVTDQRNSPPPGHFQREKYSALQRQASGPVTLNAE
jgi:hypothetical protein